MGFLVGSSLSRFSVPRASSSLSMPWARFKICSSFVVYDVDAIGPRGRAERRAELALGESSAERCRCRGDEGISRGDSRWLSSLGD